jgi:hypothetical protein
MGKPRIRVIILTEDFIMQKHTVVGSVLLTLSIVAAIAMLPDLVRYLKIRAM